MNIWKQQAMKSWGQQVKMSWQERWVLRTLESASSENLTLAELRSMLPAQDRRTRAVQSASLSRSLTRLAKRGLITIVNREYARADSTSAR